MDVTAITQIVSTLGFPIVMCAALFWELDKSHAQHKEEIGKLTESLNNNTVVMEKLLVKLGGGTSE